MEEYSNCLFRHVMPLQIRFNDVDKFGHVNNTVYFDLVVNAIVKDSTYIEDAEGVITI